MKKILAVLTLFILSLSLTFAYKPTNKDINLLNNVYKKLDIIIKKQPSKAKRLLNQINRLEGKIKNERTSYLILEIWKYLDVKLNNKDYKVLKVVDWDTIKLNFSWKEKSLRLIWIDSPESYDTRFWYKECYWDEAKRYLTSLLDKKQIKIELDSSQWLWDRYWRLLGYIIYNWENINWKLIKEWYWWEYTYNKPYKYQKDFKKYQEQAKNNKKWLWAKNTCNWERKKVFDFKNQGSQYSCDTKRYCSQMISCEEAKFYLNSCNLKRLDKDWDWTPCESLCVIK